MSYVVENESGEFLILPETPRHGSRGRVRPMPAEWGSLDHATRFDDQGAALRVARDAMFVRAAVRGAADVRVLTLAEAWDESEVATDVCASCGSQVCRGPRGWFHAASDDFNHHARPL